MDLLVSILGVVIDAVVLYFVAGFAGVRNNTAAKAFMVTVLAFIAGYFIGPLLLASLFIGMGLFFFVLIVSLFVRLILIKVVYGIGFGKALVAWILSAVVSIVVSIFLPVIP